MNLLLSFHGFLALNHQINVGTNLIYYDLDRGQIVPSGESSLRIPVNLGYEKGIEGSFFASDNITLLPWLTLYAGLRYSFFSALGPQRVRLYQEGEPKNGKHCDRFCSICQQRTDVL